METNFNRIISYFLPFLLLIIITSCATKPEDRVKAFEKAYNNHEVDKVMSLYADDASIEIVGYFVVRGEKEIRDMTEYDITQNIHLSYNECITKDDTVICNESVTNDFIKFADIKDANYSTKFIFSDGLIKQIISKPTPQTYKAWNQVLKPHLEWLSKERPQQLQEMMPEGKFIMNAENAKKQIPLLKEWKEATQPK